jgi:hypothetical protein
MMETIVHELEHLGIQVDTNGPTSFRLSSTRMNPNYSSTASKSNALSSDEMMALLGMTPDIVGCDNHI